MALNWYFLCFDAAGYRIRHDKVARRLVGDAALSGSSCLRCLATSQSFACVRACAGSATQLSDQGGEHH